MIVVDTHVLVWAATDLKKLGRKARALIDRHWDQGELAVSALSFWEATSLLERGRIDMPLSAAQWRSELLDGGVLELVVDGAIALRAAGLGGLPGDPIDRLIVATALERGAALLTADERLLGWKHAALERHDARR